jgi:acetoin utilization deacetylase AcuC-like enzyme
MRALSVFRHPDFQTHVTPEFHPERPQRLAAIDEALKTCDLAGQFVDLAPRYATEEEICTVHSPDYLEQLARKAKISEERHALIQLDGDTFLSPHSYDVAKLAAGAGLCAVESVTNDRFLSSFVAVRPPGHHARASGPMGFCLFNNIALAARFAQKHLGYKRVMIIDWDVHHGNGSQDIFYDDPSVCFLSLHQYPFWPPGSGWYTEDGAGDGRGYNINIPLPAGTDDSGYLAAWERLVKPICLEFKPNLILVSAGYDAHVDDPIGGQKITTGGYAALSAGLLELSKATQAKVVCYLEGGYNTVALAQSVVATMRVLSAESEERLQEIRDSYSSSQVKNVVKSERLSSDVEERISAVRRHFAPFWKGL